MHNVTDQDMYLFNEGTHYRLYEILGAHAAGVRGKPGTHFAVWAPGAAAVHLIGDFNGWTGNDYPLHATASSGIWQISVPNLQQGTLYKYRIRSQDGREVQKADPFGFKHEGPPKTSSIVWPLDYDWQDAQWMAKRRDRNALDAPISIYEVHPGSWMRVPEQANRSLTYREMAPRLVDHVKKMGFTHVEFMPVMEHPFYGSWGYQLTGYFAPTSRYGTPQEFMELIDALHQADIGVILDWVPAHFPTDEHGLGMFDGTHLFEHADPKQGFHPDWKSYIFNYGRNEVRSFLLSSALFWLDKYHIDGLRVDGVASMLYLDYSRAEGEWIPNRYGGRENIEAISFLRKMNETVYTNYPDVQTYAEESTAWPMVSRPTYVGGLGFGLKWDMGWMHDTLRYIELDPIYRRHHQSELTFRMMYAFNENFVMPLSHDEVVYGKGSLLNKMPGDDWQKFANLRLLYAYMFSQPGKKLLFQGAETAQWDEWNHEGSVDWHLLAFDRHVGVQRLLQALNHLYSARRELHAGDFTHRGFEWIDYQDADNSVLAYLRRDPQSGKRIAVVCNFTPMVRTNYRIGVPTLGLWKEIFNSDALEFGGSGTGNLGAVEAAPFPWHGRPNFLSLTLPPLGAIYLEEPANDVTSSPRARGQATAVIP